MFISMQVSTPLDAFTSIKSSESSSNKGSSKAIYEIITQSIEKGNKVRIHVSCCSNYFLFSLLEYFFPLRNFPRRIVMMKMNVAVLMVFSVMMVVAMKV
jgi:hypothetical protein